MGVILTLLCGVFSEELISCVIDSEGIRKYGTPLVRTLLLSGPVMGILFIYINWNQQDLQHLWRRHQQAPQLRCLHRHEYGDGEEDQRQMADRQGVHHVQHR